MYRASSQHNAAATASIENRMIAAMRLVLASSALLIIYLDPSEPDRFVPITYASLILYTAYSAILFYLAVRQISPHNFISLWSHWADVGWYLVLIALSSGTNSVFFFFFFFSVLVASFRLGFMSGLRVAVVSSVLFTIIGYATTPAGQPMEINRFLLRPVYLLVLGYMMAYWGGFEITLRRRLALLKEVSVLSNPRFGINRTIGMIMERLRAFYDADTCLLIATDPETGECLLRRTDRRNPNGGSQADPISPDLAGQILALPPLYAVIFSHRQREWWHPNYYAYDLENETRAFEGREASEELASLLNAKSYVTVPLYYHNEAAGRLFIALQQPFAFSHSDTDFLMQVFEQTIPVLDNIRLVDRLASDAAEQERQRIARNIHDSVIQPYLGLQIGLNTVRQKLSATLAGAEGIGGNLIEIIANTTDRIERLIEMTNMGIADLRRYISGLKGAGGHEDSLLSSIRRFAAKFSEATGIAVQVETGSYFHISDRLAAEVFQMVSEGLSNIRRHTISRNVIIGLECHGDYIILRIENDAEGEPVTDHFTPRSILERAEALGGQAIVERNGTDHTVVVVKIPL